MPILPLNHPDPFSAVLGIMLYPGAGDIDRRKARAFASQYLAEPLHAYHEAGHKLPYETLARISEGSGEPLDDIRKRGDKGRAMGDLYKAFFLLAKDHDKCASWESAFGLYKRHAKRHKLSSSRSHLNKVKREFLTVAPLWAVWALREGVHGQAFASKPEHEHDGDDNIQLFLAEAEILRDWGQTWRPKRHKAEPPLADNVDVWHVPEGWQPPAPRDGTAIADWILNLSLQPEDIATLRPAGRPKKSG